MTPTLLGRLQTRVFLVVVIGGLWTLAITPALPLRGGYAVRYEATGTILLAVLVLGLAWEFVYHAVQQFRWEKDWPTLLSLLTGASEGALVWWLIGRGYAPTLDGTSLEAFLLHFGSTWLVTWGFLVGPMRVLFFRWRFTGGRLR